MSSKNFMLMVVVVLILGGAIGGSFVGGMVVGGPSDGEAATQIVTLPSPGGSTTPVLTEEPAGGAPSLAQLRERARSGNLSQEDLAQLRHQIQGEFGGDGFFAGAGRFGGGGRLNGTVETVEGDKITLNTQQGPLEVTISSDTVIQRTEVVTLSLSDLTEGSQVAVTGERGENGVVAALTIFLLPEGTGGFGGRGGGFGGGQ